MSKASYTTWPCWSLAHESLKARLSSTLVRRTNGFEQFPRLNAKPALFSFELRSHISYVLDDNVMSGNCLGNQFSGMQAVACSGFAFGQPEERECHFDLHFY